MNKQLQQEAAFSPEPLWNHEDPLPELRTRDTADYLREERMIGLDSELVSEDGKDYGINAGGSWLGGDVAEEEMAHFSQFIDVPGPLLTSEIVELWRRIYARILLKLPPETTWELVVHATFHAVIRQGIGRKIAPGALIIGCLLAIAKAEGASIQTHPRDLAKDLGVRYQTLLKVKRIAWEQIDRNRVALGRAVG